jgi:PPOX class probable F420-dependent enzyme
MRELGSTHDLLLAARTARLGCLGTVGPHGEPHLVPVTFALAGDRCVLAVDHKPKTGRGLQRVRNLERDPRVSLLLDGYAEDWSTLWWVRVDGRAHISSDPAGRGAALEALQAKYRQYAAAPPSGPVIVVTVIRAVGWSHRLGAVVELPWHAHLETP